MSSKVRVGGIGTGVIFNHAHLNALILSPEVELVGIYDQDPEKAQHTRENYLNKVRAYREAGRDLRGVNDDITVFQSAEELYGKVDAVTICTHPKYHSQYAVEAMLHDCHVMSEKPMCRTWLEADYVHRVQQQTGKIFQLNDDNIFLDRFRRLRNIIESEMLGPVQLIWISRGSYGLEGPTFSPWFWNPMESGGGCILDYGSHALTSMWFVLGFDKVPVEVRSLGIQSKFRTRNIGGRIQQIDNDDDAHFKVCFVDPKTSDWSTVFIEATWSGSELGKSSSDVNGYIEIECAMGTITAANDPEDGKDYFILRHRMFGERIVPFKYAHGEEDSFVSEVTNFALCVQGGHRPVLSSEEGTKVMGVLNAAQLSQMRGMVNTTLEDVQQFSQEIAAQEPDIWKASDRITELLTSGIRKV